MKFTSWELLALEKQVEKGLKDGSLEKASGEKLLSRLQREKPRKLRHVIKNVRSTQFAPVL